MKPWEKYADPGAGPWAKYGGERQDVAGAFARGEASNLIPGQPALPPEQGKPEGLADKLIALPDAALTMASSVPASFAGNIAGAARTVTSGKFGSPEGIAEGANRAEEVSGKLTLQPKSELGKSAVERINAALEASGVMGLNPAEPIGMAGRVSPRGVGAVGRDVSGRIGDAAVETAKGEGLDLSPQSLAPTMSGVGAAESGVEAVRRERAASLPAPMKLTKGQATRDFQQQRFERETAKQGKEGKPLRERFADQNQAILQNFDQWIDQTGAQAPTLRATGQTVDRALVAKANRAKAEINAEYERARKAGETAARVPTDDLVAWIEENRSKARNAPVIATIEDELVRLKGAQRGEGGALKPGHISINDMEELRKTVNDVMGIDPTNKLFGGKAKDVIDKSTEGRGGEIYRRARDLRAKYAREFEDHAVVDKLLSTKPGTRDRAVAYENVFAHSILNGSLDDVKTLGRTLKTAGPEGQAAWRELQGQTIEYIRQEAIKGVRRDERGNPIVSASALDKVILDLDRSGKLEYLFGKQGAQQLRDLNDLAKDVFVAPPGTVNYSGTASVILGALGDIALGKFGAAGKIIAQGKKMVDARKTRARIREALGDEGDPAALSPEDRNRRVGDLVGETP